MAEPFKNMYNEQFLERFSKDLIVVIPDFDTREFASQVMDNEWENRELKERCKHITTVLKKYQTCPVFVSSFVVIRPRHE